MAEFGSLAPDVVDAPGQGAEDPIARVLRFMRARQQQIDPMGTMAGNAVLGNTRSLLNESAPAMMTPDTPGKVPSTSPWDDPRIPGAIMEMGALAPAGMAARAAPMGAEFAERTLGNAAQAAPGLAATPGKSLAAILGTGATVTTGQALAADDPVKVKEMQTQLKEAGFYSGKIDGVMGEGTKAAKQAFDAAADKRRADDLAERKAATELETARAQGEAARAQIEASKAQGANLKYKQEGGERLQQMEADVPWYRQALRDYGTPIGLTLGTAAGLGTRAGVTAASNKISDVLANRAEGLFDKKMTGLPQRTARVNEFWRKGGASADEYPFNPAPTKATGIELNPEPAAIGNLFQPATKKNLATDIGIPAAFGADAAYGQFALVPQARAELERAQQAASNDPSEVNIRGLQAAKDRAAMMDMITNFGRAGAAGYAGGALKIQRNPSVPNMQKAETERLLVERLLRAAAKRAGE